jgi:hypothetical protein
VSTPISIPPRSPAPVPKAADPLSIADVVMATVGLLLHAAVGVFVAASGLMMPAFAVLLMILLWVMALWFAILHRRRPLVVLVTPLATFGVWYLTGWAGETFLGWTG